VNINKIFGLESDVRLSDICPSVELKPSADAIVTVSETISKPVEIPKENANDGINFFMRGLQGLGQGSYASLKVYTM
jgi:hypothetical protein